MKLLLVLLTFVKLSHASVPELFGTSAFTMGIANQPNFDLDDSSGHALIPAFSAFSKSSNFSVGMNFVQTNFNKMTNIVVENNINSAASNPVIKDYDPNLELQSIASIHTSYKLFKNSDAKILVSFYTPADKLLEASTGDPYLPEYFVYKSRLQRSLFYINFANKFGDSLGYSVGVITGIQSAGQTNVVAKESGSPDDPSLGQMSFNATPSLAPSLSIYKKWSEESHSYLSFISSMKSNFTNEAVGITPVGSSALRYDWTFKSLIFYDPAIIRMGHHKRFQNISVFLTLEYQGWNDYETPKLKMINNGGILSGTKDYELFSAHDIWIPKLGVEYKAASNTYSAGISYRKSPFENDLSVAGNSIDTDSTILSAGYKREIILLGNKFTFGTSSQVHILKEDKITKTINNENNQAGSKIGSPGYNSGGHIFILSFGLNWVI